MDCPKGQVYWQEGKRCVYPEALPGAKGKSLSPCPPGKVWLAGARKCVLKETFEKHYGKTKLASAIRKQKVLGQRSVKNARRVKTRAKTVRAPVKPHVISPKKAHPVAAAFTPAVHKILRLRAATPRKNSHMPPGLKTKKDMVAWVSDKCSNKEDSISLEPFSEMDMGDLKTIVRLGNDYCYLADDLDKHVKASVDRDAPVKNIANPWYRLDAADLGAIEHMGKMKNSTYKLPFKSTAFPADHYKLFIDVVDDSPFKFVFLYDERKIVAVEDGGLNYSPAIPKGGFLGYIPEHNTEKLTALIQKAFIAGRLFTKVTRPFECCRFHLKKNKDFWATERLKKIKAMEEEISEFI